MKIGNIAVYLIAGLVLGALLGWAVAFIIGLGSTGQSTYTGWGSLVGLVVAGIFGYSRRFA